jgi:hypothetical protein
MAKIHELQQAGLIPGGIKGSGAHAAFCVNTRDGDYIRLFETEYDRDHWLAWREVHGPFHDHQGTALERL